ncbi:unnamed protein product, partial [Brassica oleracea]
CTIYKLYCYPCLILKPLTTGEPLSSGRTESNSLDMNKTTKKKRGENTDVATHAKRKQETNISGERLPDALRDITNSSNNITKDARTERRLKLLQKRKNAEFGSPEVTQSEIVNVQSVGSTLPGSARSIDGANNISQATNGDSQVTFQPTVKESNTGPISSTPTNLLISEYTSTAITVDSDSSVSDSGDDLWDCSSNEGGEILSDSDTSDDINSEVDKRNAQKKFDLVSKAEKAFAEMLSRLNKQIPAKTSTTPVVCIKKTKAQGTCVAKEKPTTTSLKLRPVVSSKDKRETATFNIL